MKFNIPAPVALVLAILAGAAEYANQTFVNLPTHWHAALTYGVLVIGLLGVLPAVGNQLGQDIRAALHVSPVVYTIVGVLATAATAAVTTFAMTGVAKGIILGVVAFLASCGFASVDSVNSRV